MLCFTRKKSWFIVITTYSKEWIEKISGLETKLKICDNEEFKHLSGDKYTK